jgi:predicted transcriptional regulator YdeE
MKVMVIVKASKSSEAGVMPSEQLLTEMGNYNEELVKAGVMLSGDGLHPSSKGKRVRFSGMNRTVIDGPFAETKELIAGFWIWQVKSMEEAVEWLKKCPNPMDEESDVEIRPIFTAEDFGEAYTPELREREERMIAEMERYQLDPPRYENGPRRLIAGFNQTYTFENRDAIPAQWTRFSYHFGKVPGQLDPTAYGVCWNFKEGVGFDYLTGVEVADGTALPEGFSEVALAAGRYAAFTHNKHVSKIPQTIEAIWCKWLPNSGHQMAESPSFERYTTEFNPQTGLGGTEIWVPLKG